MTIEICDRCGSDKINRSSNLAKGKLPCDDCGTAMVYFRVPFGAEPTVLSWLERVIDRKIRKAFAERRLP